MKKIITVFGTRPDAIKMAPVVLELKKHPSDVDLRVVVTGQHREMLDQVLSVFKITPDFDLNIMQPGQTLSEITTRALTGLDPIFASEKPDAVLAQGDTTTTFVAALAAFYHRAEFGHVEAGLRTGNRFDPFPEETNRLLTTRLASLHFAPTREAADNLLREGVPAESVFLTGNTVIDALLTTAKSDYSLTDPALSQIMALTGPVVLVTAHRRENWGAPLRRICNALRRLVADCPDINVVFPMHRNPIVRETVYETLGDLDRVNLIEPPDYAPFVKLLQKSTIVLTDSGGVQEEAPSLGKPVLVLRETTERPEGVSAGTAKLIGTDSDLIYQESHRLLTDHDYYESMAHAASPYGDGTAAAQIVDALTRHLSA
jgi:UDP-N-acetylglucosamine 2-epimerase (non-hydrolysing)